jgi:hypothetical protein
MISPDVFAWMIGLSIFQALLIVAVALFFLLKGRDE